MKKKRANSTPSKLTNLRKNLRFILTQHLSGRNFRPSTTEELIKRLAILPEQTHIFTQVLEEMANEGLLRKSKAGAWMAHGSKAHTYYEGVISFHPRGFAFVRLDEPSDIGDVFIPPSQTLNALPSDHVCIEITGQDRKGPEGRVVHILKRGKNSLHGIVLEDGNGKTHSKVSVLVPALSQHRIGMNLKKNEIVRFGERIILKVLDWEKKEHEITCSLVEKLGHIDDASCDIDIAISEFGLKREFPTEALDEAMGFGLRVSSKEIAQRRDLRNLLTVTIDPDTAKDFDDAISIEKIGDYYHLGVHIADVAHYVKLHSALDREARERCNSTYFPGYCLPMLPHELSNELCSLKPNVNRLTVSVLMRLDSAGQLLEYEIVRSVIRSKKRLTYRKALEIIEGKTKSPLAPMLHLMVELCQKLKVHKAQRGSIEFSLPESVILCNQQGEPQGVDFVAYDITHQMIEEFMVKANEVVASHLSKIGRDMIYRIHEAPLLDDLRDFFQVARFFGHQFHGMPTPQEWHKFFQSIQTAPYASQLATAYIRSMRLAQYSTTNVGHYGLGLEYYCHFTSPIRRYSDLTVFRALFDEPRDTGLELENMAQRCCDCERNSAKAEQNVLELKKLRYLHKQAQADGNQKWQAIVTRIKPFGITFEIQHLLLEGFIHISRLSDDFFIYDEPNQALRGRHSGLTLRAGTNIEVMLEQVDLIYRECKWKLHPQFIEQAAFERAQRRLLREKQNQENHEPISAAPATTDWPAHSSKGRKKSKAFKEQSKGQEHSPKKPKRYESKSKSPNPSHRSSKFKRRSKKR